MAQGKEQRYLDLLARIDGGTRKKQLEEELKQLRTAFMETHGNAERQDSFVKRHEADLVGLEKKSPDTQHVSREAIIEAGKEKSALTWLAVEHLADEVEKLEKRIKKIDRAGLPEPEPEEEAEEEEEKTEVK